MMSKLISVFVLLSIIQLSTGNPMEKTEILEVNEQTKPWDPNYPKDWADHDPFCNGILNMIIKRVCGEVTLEQILQMKEKMNSAIKKQYWKSSVTCCEDSCTLGNVKEAFCRHEPNNNEEIHFIDVPFIVTYDRREPLFLEVAVDIYNFVNNMLQYKEKTNTNTLI